MIMSPMRRIGYLLIGITLIFGGYCWLQQDKQLDTITTNNGHTKAREMLGERKREIVKKWEAEWRREEDDIIVWLKSWTNKWTEADEGHKWIRIDTITKTITVPSHGNTEHDTMEIKSNTVVAIYERVVKEYVGSSLSYDPLNHCIMILPPPYLTSMKGKKELDAVRGVCKRPTEPESLPQPDTVKVIDEAGIKDWLNLYIGQYHDLVVSIQQKDILMREDGTKKSRRLNWSPDLAFETILEIIRDACSTHWSERGEHIRKDLGIMSFWDQSKELTMDDSMQSVWIGSADRK